MSRMINQDLQSKKEWIEMFPYGLAVSPSGTRPVMIFKDKNEEKVLPVWLSPLDAGIAVSQSGGSQTDASPHRLTWKMLEPLGVALDKCFFTEVKGHHQFVELQFSGNDKLKNLESRADEAISFCLSTECQFFCKKDFIDQCRVVDAEMELPEVAQDLGPLEPHPYIN